ncbi:MAG: FtsX-like permease family protein [Bacteroidetes bacterium]|nr:MAG: FtsX-like permease family protein [Bacteroidota bacterium]
MWTNYLKVALRSLFKNKSFSFINIFGLAASMSVCLLVIMLIRDAYQFDRFHPESDRVYRMITDAQRKGGGEESYATIPLPVGKALTEDFSYVQSWVPLVRRLNGDFRYDGKTLPVRGLLTDGAFFDVFGFQLEYGNPLTVLTEPNSIVLTSETAQKFFPGSNPVGQVLENDVLGNFKVTGVLAPFPGKTHLEFEALGALSTLTGIEQANPELSPVLDNWNNYYSTYSFVRLREGVSKEAAEQALKQIATDAFADLELESRDAGYRFRLQSLGQITPGPVLSNNMGRGLPELLLWFLGVLSGIVILSACFNYTNLTIARALNRAKEIGVRKVMGASRWQVFRQFISESIVVAGIALVLAFGLLQLTIPLFNQLQFLEFSDVSLVLDAPVAGWFLAFAIVVGLVAGLLPALVLSRFQPLAIMQKLQNVRLFSRIGLRKVLLVSQFAVSLFFMVMLTIIWKQVNYALQGNFGFGEHTLVNIDTQDKELGPLFAEFRQNAHVEQVSAVSHLMGTWEDSKIDVRTEMQAEPFGVRDYFVDDQYLDNMDLKLVAGTSFPDNPTQQRELFAVVNPKFLEQFKLGTPAEAIGKPIIIGDSTTLTIRGVVEDFLYKPLNYALEPLLLRYDPAQWNILNVRLKTTDVPAAITALERSWKRIDPSTDLSYQFYDETVQENFANLYDIIWIVAYFGAMGILIACMGLLGMAIYSVETRAKEISIRKVIGAAPADLIRMLSKGYLSLLVVATLLAVPASFLLGSKVLESFAFHIPLNVLVFIPGILVLFGLGMLTIGSQTVRAALNNPANQLRTE